MAFEISGGGGGASFVKISESDMFIPIKDVLNQSGVASGDTKESLLTILKGKPISEDNFSIAKNALSSLNDNKVEVENIYTNYFGSLEKTGSKRLNLSQNATKNEKLLININNNIGNLQQSIDSFVRDNLKQTIKEYNTTLEKMKLGAKVKLLIMRAKEVDADAKAGYSRFYYDGRKNVYFEGAVKQPTSCLLNEKTWKRIEDVKPTTTSYPNPSDPENSVTYTTTYSGHFTEYKYISYQNLGLEGKSLTNCSSADVSKLEEKFKVLGIPLPY